MTEEEGKTQKEFEGFVSSALRGPKMGIYQNLLAGLIIRASTTPNSLKKIQNICEAAFLCKKKDKLDMDLVEVASTTCASLLNTEIPQKKGEGVEIAWAFSRTEENWKKYIKPWQKTRLGYHTFQTSCCYNKYPRINRLLHGTYVGRAYDEAADMAEEVQDKVRDAIDKMPPHKAFFNKTGALAKNSFFKLKGEFGRWALTKLLPIEVTIADQIDPRVYGEVAALMMGRKEEEEQIESSVDQRQRRSKV